MDSSSSTNSTSNYTMQVPELGKTLKKFLHFLRKYIPHFINANIITYFVSKTASDGLKVKDFKAMNSFSHEFVPMWSCTTASGYNQIA